MQYRGPKFKKFRDWKKFCLSRIFGIKQFLVLPTCWELLFSFWIKYLEF